MMLYDMGNTGDIGRDTSCTGDTDDDDDAGNTRDHVEERVFFCTSLIDGRGGGQTGRLGGGLTCRINVFVVVVSHIHSLRYSNSPWPQDRGKVWKQKTEFIHYQAWKFNAIVEERDPDETGREVNAMT